MVAFHQHVDNKCINYYPFSTKLVPGLVRSQCLISNQFFAFRQSKKGFLVRKNGFTLAPTLCWSITNKTLESWAGGWTAMTKEIS